jgi:hypothetical protein
MFTRFQRLADSLAATADLREQQATSAIEPEREAFHSGYAEGTHYAADAVAETIVALQILFPHPDEGRPRDHRDRTRLPA